MDMLHELNWVDHVFLAILILSSVVGLFRGAIREFISLLSWLAGYCVAVAFAKSVAKWIEGFSFFTQLTHSTTQSLGSDTTTQVSMVAVGLSFILLFFITVFIGSLIGRFLTTALESGGMGFMNRSTGVVMGLGRGYLTSLVLIFVIQLTPMAADAVWQDSKVVAAYHPSVEWFSAKISPSLDQFKDQVKDFQ